MTNNVAVTNDVPISNPGTIVIGSTTPSYIVLTPTTNATLELIASTTGSNGIDMLVFSCSQNIFHVRRRRFLSTRLTPPILREW